MAEALLEQKGAGKIKKIVFGTPWTNTQFAIDGALNAGPLGRLEPRPQSTGTQPPDISLPTGLRHVYAIGLCCSVAEDTSWDPSPAFMRFVIVNSNLSELTSGSGTMQTAHGYVEGISYAYTVSDGDIALVFSFSRTSDYELPYYALTVYGAEVWGR